MTESAIPRRSCVLIRSVDTQACVNLNDAEIIQDKSLKKRFVIVCNRERRKFFFESVLDVDHADWFSAIKKNIKVDVVWTCDPESLANGEKFKSIDEDDYIAPGTPITPDIERVCFHRMASSIAPRAEEAPPGCRPEAAGEVTSHSSPEREG